MGKVIYRSAVTGKLVTKKFAEENPYTTVEESLELSPSVKKYLEEVLESCNRVSREASDNLASDLHESLQKEVIDKLTIILG